MISRFSRLISAMLLVAIAIYVVIINREPATFSIGGAWSVTANVGVLLITSFCFGVLATSLVALVFGFRAWLRERRLNSIDKQRQSFIGGLLHARDLNASGEWKKARELWQSLSRKDPSDIIARTELSRSFELAGDLEDALKVIDAVRADHPESVEVLFRAFEVQRAIGNRTAALDNLALILAKSPNLRAATEARTLSEDLGRIADAIEYHEQCISLGEHPDVSTPRGATLHFKLLMQSAPQKDGETLIRELTGFLKRYPALVEGHLALADAEKKQGRNAEAAQALVNAAKAGAGSSAWNQAAQLWLNEGKPERAIAAAKSAALSASGIHRIEADLFRAQLQLGLNQAEDAEKTLSAASALVHAPNAEISNELLTRYQGLQALCAFRLGKTAQVVSQLSDLVGLEHSGTHGMETPSKGAARPEPSPIYSTP